jgi:hypothetical protein
MLIRHHVAPASSINSSGDKLTDRGIEHLQAEDRQSRLQSDAKDPLRQTIERQLTGVSADEAAQDQPDQQRDVRTEGKTEHRKAHDFESMLDRHHHSVGANELVAAVTCGSDKRCDQHTRPADEHRHDGGDHTDDEKLDPACGSTLEFGRPGRDKNEDGDNNLKRVLQQPDDKLGSESSADNRAK